MIKNISNLGDAALYCDFGNEVNKSINSQVIKYFKTIKEKKFEGINNLTPSYNKLIISYDLKKTNFKEVKNYVENINAQDSKDINSKIIKDADFKFYITAKVNERAKRRYKELKKMGKKVKFKDILKNLKRRDLEDRSRRYSKLKKTKNSVLINTTNLSKRGSF